MARRNATEFADGRLDPEFVPVDFAARKAGDLDDPIVIVGKQRLRIDADMRCKFARPRSNSWSVVAERIADGRHTSSDIDPDECGERGFSNLGAGVDECSFDGVAVTAMSSHDRRSDPLDHRWVGRRRKFVHGQPASCTVSQRGVRERSGPMR